METKEDSELVEILAEYSHEAWSGWIAYMFSKMKSGRIPVWAMDRWSRQSGTLYKGLSEEEKLSDRKEARKIIEIIRSYNEIKR